MTDDPIAQRLLPWLSRVRARTVLQGLLRVPSPQADLFEAEPLLRTFMNEFQCVSPQVVNNTFRYRRHRVPCRLSFNCRLIGSQPSLFVLSDNTDAKQSLFRIPSCDFPNQSRCANIL